MAFKKMDKTQLPPRQWALVGYPGSGKARLRRRCRAAFGG